MTGIAKGTVLRLLRDLGFACYEHHDATDRNLQTKRVQADELWCFVGAKQRNLPANRVSEGWGDAWTWTAIDSDSKLCISFVVGGRGSAWAFAIMRDLAERVANRIQITTDGHRHYYSAVAEAFQNGLAADYAQLIKVFGPAPQGPEQRYSPPTCIGCEVKEIFGSPDPKHISTSYVERQNLTIRMCMRRFTRLTNGFSRKLENLRCAVALHFAYYNFCRIHQTLGTTPAVAAGIADHAWTLDELIALLEKNEKSAADIWRVTSKAN